MGHKADKKRRLVFLHIYFNKSILILKKSGVSLNYIYLFEIERVSMC